MKNHQTTAFKTSSRWPVVLKVLCLTLFTALSPSLLRGQTNSAKPVAPSNRFLLIVDTSRVMERRSDSTLKVAQGLLVSGMNGQLRQGDTLGVWTFNQELYTGRLPLQQWSPETQAQRAVAKRTLDFLKTQKYEKQANFGKVLPTLDRVIKGSGFITVLLISSGEEKIHGTPFDEEINHAFKLWRQQQKEARMPIVTVLRGKSGKITDYSVTASPWTVEIPPLQAEKEITEAAPPKQEPAPQKAPPPAVPPLILSGKKTLPLPLADPTATNLQPPSVDATKETSKVPDAAPAPATSEKPAATAPPATTANVEGPSPATAAAKIEAAPLVPGQPIEAAPTQTNQAGTTKADKPNPPSAESSPAGLDSAVATAPTNSAAPSSAAPAEGRPALSSPTAVVRARESTQSSQTAVVAPPEPLLRQISFWLVLGIVAAISLAVIVLLMRRARASPAASLITRSLDPNEK